MKNAARYIPGIFSSLLRLDYPRHKLSLGFLEGDSEDGSWELLRGQASLHEGHFRRIACLKYDAGLRLDGPRWLPEFQRQRRGIIARCRNMLFKALHQDEPWTLWLDADVVEYPDDALLRLLTARKSIIVPHCVQEPLGSSFDLNTFRFLPGGEQLAASYLVDGLIQPPRGAGRQYLESFRGQDLVELDSVGGTMLLVESSLKLGGLLFPEHSLRGYIETEGFALQAREQGISCWGMPDLEIIHARN